MKLLIDKIKPIGEIDFKKAEYENIEGLALGYIYVTLIILTRYETNQEDSSYMSEKNLFSLEEWINDMQNSFHFIKQEIFGWLAIRSF